MSYRIIRNATHEALRMADADAYLDDVVRDAVEAEKRAALTPARVRKALAEASE